MRKYFLFTIFIFTSAFLHAGDSDPLKKCAKELARALSQEKDIRLAIFPVPHHDGHQSDGPAWLAEHLSTQLAAEKGITLIERNQMDQILSEYYLSQTGVTDPKTAKMMGTLLGANMILTGTMIDLPNRRTEVNLRVIMIGTGRVIAAQRLTLNRTWEARPRLDWE